MMPHVRGAAARRFSTSGFSTERVGRPHTPGHSLCDCPCAGGAGVVKKIRRRCPLEDRCRVFVSRAASADRCDRTKPRATESHGVTSEGPQLLSRGALCGAHAACVRCVVCGATALCGAGEPSKTCVPGSTEPAPLLADLRQRRRWLGRQCRLRSRGASCHQHTSTSPN